MKRRVIMFQPEFADKVQSFEKFQTIRKNARCSPGDILSLRRWTGKPYRSKQAIIREVTCTKVLTFVIGSDSRFLVIDGLDPHLLDAAESAVLANQDGFDTQDEMVDLFQRTYGLPFYGEIIEWFADVPACWDVAADGEPCGKFGCKDYNTNFPNNCAVTHGEKEETVCAGCPEYMPAEGGEA